MSVVSPYQLDRILDNVFGANMSVEDGRSRYSQTADQNAYVIQAPMIGVTKDDLVVNIVGNKLSVRADASVKSRFSNSFSQEWMLSADVDVSAINVTLTNGLMTLTIPRNKPAVQKINVTIQ